MSRTSTHIFRAQLRPRVYREIEIESTKSLYDLAAAIVQAFDFDFDHAFGFYSKLDKYVFDSPCAMNSSPTWRAAARPGASSGPRWPRRSPPSAPRCSSSSTTATTGDFKSS